MCLGVIGREGEEGTTELGDRGRFESIEREGGEGEGDEEHGLSGTGDDGSERHEDEDNDEALLLSISNVGDEGVSEDFPSPLFTLARLF